MREEKIIEPQNNSGEFSIISDGDVHIGDVSGQFAAGSNIHQSQTITQTLSGADKQELFKSLQQFQKEIGKMNLPADEATNVNSNVNLAIKEAEKPEPDVKKIQAKFQGAIDTLKEVGEIQTISNWDKTIKILGILGKMGLKILL